jgi:hypothetical protein
VEDHPARVAVDLYVQDTLVISARGVELLGEPAKLFTAELR